MSAGPGVPAGRLGLGLATVLVAGNLIGSGIYLLPATLATIGSISIFGWIIATIGALVLAGVFSLMMIVRPTEDGLADIVRAGLGPYWGFQSSLLYWIGCWLANIAIALALAVGLMPLLAVSTLGWLWFGPELFARSWNVSRNAIDTVLGPATAGLVAVYAILKASGAPGGGGSRRASPPTSDGGCSMC